MYVLCSVAGCFGDALSAGAMYSTRFKRQGLHANSGLIAVAPTRQTARYVAMQRRGQGYLRATAAARVPRVAEARVRPRAAEAPAHTHAAAEDFAQGAACVLLHETQ